MAASRITRSVLLASFLILVLLVAAAPGQAANNWTVGSTVGLCKDAPIRTGSGLNYDIHTYVPENGWAVVIKDGPRYADGHTWWDIDRGATGDPSGGTGWIIQSQNENCPVDNGGAGNDGGGSDGGDGGGTLAPKCDPMTPIGVLSPDYQIDRLSFETLPVNIGLVSQRSFKYETLLTGGVCKDEVNIQFDAGEPFKAPPSLTFDSGDYSFQFDDTLKPVGTGVTAENVTTFVEEYPHADPAFYSPGIYWGTLTTYEATDNPDYPEYGVLNLDVSTKGGIVDKFRKLAYAYIYDYNFNYNHNYTPSFGYENPEEFEVPEWAYYLLAAGVALGIMIGGYVVAGVVITALEGSSLAVAASSMILFLQTTLGFGFNYGVMNTPLQAPESRTHLVMVGESYNVPSAASVDVMDALRDNYGPLVDMATVTTLYTSRDTVSAYTVFEVSGEGFTPGDVVYVEMKKPGDRPLFGVALTPDVTGAIHHRLQMPPDPDGLPLGAYTITALDTSSMAVSLQRIANGDSEEINAYMAGATVDVVEDVTPPNITITSPEPTAYTRCEMPPVDFTVTDDLSGVDWTTALLDGEGVANGDTIDMLFWNLGTHSLTVESADKVGNQAAEGVAFELEATIAGMQCALDRFYEDGLVDGDGTYNALSQQLTAAEAALMRGQQRTAANILSAFQQHVGAQTGKKIDPSAGTIFGMDSNSLISEYQGR